MFDKVVEVAPGSNTTVFWNGRTRGSNRVAELFIPPGPYPVTIVTDYWLKKEDAEQKSTDSRQSYSTIITVLIEASESTIMIGAGIGGVIAYFLLPGARFFTSPTGQGKKRSVVLREYAQGVAASILLSITATILLSRLADTQFIVKVTVNDIWGAIAIGFVASASGKKIFQGILGAQHQSPVSSEPQKETLPPDTP